MKYVLTLIVLLCAVQIFGEEGKYSEYPNEINGITLCRVGVIKDGVAVYNEKWQESSIGIAIGIVMGSIDGRPINEMITGHEFYKSNQGTSYLLKCKSGTSIRMTTGKFGWFVGVKGAVNDEALYYSILSVTALYKDDWNTWSKSLINDFNNGQIKTKGALLDYFRSASQNSEINLYNSLK